MHILFFIKEILGWKLLQLLYLPFFFFFFVSKPAKLARVAFSAWIESHAQIGFGGLNHALSIMHADRAEWLQQLTSILESDRQYGARSIALTR